MVGRDDEISRILAAWMGWCNTLPLSPLLVGEAGVGKNRIVYECARMCEKDLFIFQGHEDVAAEDLVCAVRFSDDSRQKMDYIVSPLVTAMLRGGVCFIDEIAKIRPRALAPLASLLDERRYLDSSLLGERVYAAAGFRFVAATNTADLEVNVLPDFIRSRVRPVIHVQYPDRAEIDMILRSRHPSVGENFAGLLDCFWSLWRAKNGKTAPTPRDSIHIFGYALNLAGFEWAGHSGPAVLENNEAPDVMKNEHLERAFETFYQSGSQVQE
jgi:MoxR-like ATPase